MPQIEVTFDIDANGIVNVSAKDLGTGKEQNITITSSTNLTEEEINQKVKEAEQYAAEDKKKKEQVEARNRAENLIYQTDTTMKDIEDKLSPEEKSGIETAKAELQSALDANNPDDIKAKEDTLMQKLNEVSTKIYQQAQADAAAQGAGPDMSGMGGAGPNMGGMGGAAAGGPTGSQDDNVVDADYTVVDDDQ